MNNNNEIIRNMSLKYAQKHYANAKQIIEELSAIANKIYDDFHFAQSMQQFDLILQAILLCVAIEDGRLNQDEVYFIKKIFKNEDILVALNKSHENDEKWIDVTWDNIMKVNYSTLRIIVGLTVAVADKVAVTFSKYFGRIDSIMQKDYFTLLKSEILDIITSFSMGVISPEDGAIKTEDSIKAQKRGFYISKCIWEDKWKM